MFICLHNKHVLSTRRWRPSPSTVLSLYQTDVKHGLHVCLHLQGLEPGEVVELAEAAQALDLVVAHVELLQAGHRLQPRQGPDPVPPQVELLQQPEVLEA